MNNKVIHYHKYLYVKSGSLETKILQILVRK